MEDYKSIAHILNVFPDEQACIAHLELLRWNGTVVSPFNPISKVYACKAQYRCSMTRKYFNVKTGTLFHNSKIPLQQWFVAIWIVSSDRPNITSVALGKELNITQKTAWYMIQRIKNYYHIEKTFSKKESKWPLFKRKALKQESLVVENIEPEKLELLEWFKILKK